MTTIMRMDFFFTIGSTLGLRTVKTATLMEQINKPMPKPLKKADKLPSSHIKYASATGTKQEINPIIPSQKARLSIF